MTKRELLQMALEVLEVSVPIREEDGEAFIAAFRALRAELAKPEPEPAGYFLEGPGNRWAKYGFVQIGDDRRAIDDASDYVTLYRKEDL